MHISSDIRDINFEALLFSEQWLLQLNLIFGDYSFFSIRKLYWFSKTMSRFTEFRDVLIDNIFMLSTF